MKTKLFASLVVLAILVASPAIGQTQTTVPAKDVIKLTFNDHNPPKMPVSNSLIAYAKYIEEKSGGRVKIDVILGGALLKQDQAMRGVQTRVADAATYTMNKMDGFYLNDVITLPFMGWPGRDETTKIYWTLLKKFPEMRKEWEGATYRAFGMMPPVQMHWVDRVVRKPADVKGVKAFCTHAVYTESYAKLGGVPVDMDISDMYTSVERGVVEGVVNHMPVLNVFGVLELLESHTIFGEGGISMAPIGVIWNNDKYNSLPDDIKKIVDDGAQVYYDTFMKQERGYNAMVENKARKLGHTFIELTPEEIAEWRDIIKDAIHNKWIKEAESKGLPGHAVYNEVLRLIATK